MHVAKGESNHPIRPRTRVCAKELNCMTVRAHTLSLPGEADFDSVWYIQASFQNQSVYGKMSFCCSSCCSQLCEGCILTCPRMACSSMCVSLFRCPPNGREQWIDYVSLPWPSSETETLPLLDKCCRPDHKHTHKDTNAFHYATSGFIMEIM